MKNSSTLNSFNQTAYSKPAVLTILTQSRINKSLKLIGKGKRVLDIGCYDGQISKMIKDHGNEVVGVDISMGAVKLARKNGIESYVLDLEKENPPRFLKEFDVVYAGEIIEHILDTDSFIQKIKKMLKPNGKLVITTPNLAGLGPRISLLIGKKPWMIENSLKGIKAGHIRYFNHEELENLLTDNGFIPEQFVSDSIGLGDKIIVPLLEKIVPTLGRILIIKARLK